MYLLGRSSSLRRSSASEYDARTTVKSHMVFNSKLTMHEWNSHRMNKFDTVFTKLFTGIVGDGGGMLCFCRCRWHRLLMQTIFYHVTLHLFRFDVYIIYLYRLFTRLSVLICRNLYYLYLLLFFSLLDFLFVVVFVFFCYSLHEILWMADIGPINVGTSFHQQWNIVYFVYASIAMAIVFFPFLFFPFCRSQFLFEKLKINLDCQSYNSDACPLMWLFLLVVFSPSFFTCFDCCCYCYCYCY